VCVYCISLSYGLQQVRAQLMAISYHHRFTFGQRSRSLGAILILSLLVRCGTNIVPLVTTPELQSKNHTRRPTYTTDKWWILLEGQMSKIRTTEIPSQGWEWQFIDWKGTLLKDGYNRHKYNIKGMKIKYYDI